MKILAVALLIQDLTIGRMLGHSILVHCSFDRSALVALINSIKTTSTVPLTQGQYGREYLWSLQCLRKVIAINSSLK